MSEEQWCNGESIHVLLLCMSYFNPTINEVACRAKNC